MLLDVELETLLDNDELVDFIAEQETRILVSWHDFEKTPTNDKLVDVLGQMRIYSNYVKIATAAQNVHDCIRLLDLYDETNRTKLNIIRNGRTRNFISYSMYDLWKCAFYLCCPRRSSCPRSTDGTTNEKAI